MCRVRMHSHRKGRKDIRALREMRSVVVQQAWYQGQRVSRLPSQVLGGVASPHNHVNSSARELSMKVSLRKEDETSGLFKKTTEYALYVKAELTPEDEGRNQECRH